MKEYSLSIAGFGVCVIAGDAFPDFSLPRSFAPFAARGGEETVLTLEIAADEAPRLDGLRPMATGINDLGEARLYARAGGYAVALSLFPGSPFRVMTADSSFSRATLFLPAGDQRAAYAADSMLRIAFSQAIASRRAFLLHASAVEAAGRAVLFMGRSGTGKSTHASLWLRSFPDASLVNDDNPVVRLLPDGTARAYGSPWSGKTPCYRNVSAPVSAFVRLRQAPREIFTRLADVDAFIAILPGVSVIARDSALYDAACSSVAEAAAAATVGILDCRPLPEAARLCRRHTLGFP